eukprot:2315164-Rhodomonas_salina.4
MSGSGIAHGGMLYDAMSGTVIASDGTGGIGSGGMLCDAMCAEDATAPLSSLSQPGHLPYLPTHALRDARYSPTHCPVLTRRAHPTHCPVLTDTHSGPHPTPKRKKKQPKKSLMLTEGACDGSRGDAERVVREPRVSHGSDERGHVPGRGQHQLWRGGLRKREPPGAR